MVLRGRRARGRESLIFCSSVKHTLFLHLTRLSLACASSSPRLLLQWSREICPPKVTPRHCSRRRPRLSRWRSPSPLRPAMRRRGSSAAEVQAATAHSCSCSPRGRCWTTPSLRSREGGFPMLSTPGKLQLVEAKRWSARERKAVGGHATSTTPDNGETRALLFFSHPKPFDLAFHPLLHSKTKRTQKTATSLRESRCKGTATVTQWQGIPELLLLLEGERERRQPPANTTAATTTLLSPLPSAPASRSSSASSASRGTPSRCA